MDVQISHAGECIHKVSDYHKRYITITDTFRSLLPYCLHRNTPNTVQHAIIYSLYRLDW